MRLLLHQFRNEQRLFWRSRELAFFTFALPILLFLLLGSVYGSDLIDGVKGSRYLLAGLAGYGVVATAFAGLAISTVIRREEGILKRIRGTPLPASGYVGAVLGSILLVYALQTAVLLVLGRLLFDVPFPERWLSFVLALLLGGVSFAALGLGVTAAIRSAEGSSAVVNALYLPMSFISGSFFSPHKFPNFLERIADVLPLTYFIRLVRDVVLHGDEIWSSWESVAAVAAWGLVGVVAAVHWFRWEPRER